MKTKDRIIATAIELFNEKGTKAVSTNHIAAAAGISPGNLYYHFRNKEEIIRSILARLDEQGMEEYQKILERHELGSARALIEVFEIIQKLNWRYRFFKRELAALFLNDPLLKQQATSAPENMIMIARANIDAAVEKKHLKNIPEESRALLAEEFCMINLFWVNYLDIWDMEITEENLKRGSEHMLFLMRPYLTKKGLAESILESEETKPDS